MISPRCQRIGLQDRRQWRWRCSPAAGSSALFSVPERVLGSGKGPGLGFNPPLQKSHDASVEDKITGVEERFTGVETTLGAIDTQLATL